MNWLAIFQNLNFFSAPRNEYPVLSWKPHRKELSDRVWLKKYFPNLYAQLDYWNERLQPYFQSSSVMFAGKIMAQFFKSPGVTSLGRICRSPFERLIHKSVTIGMVLATMMIAKSMPTKATLTDLRADHIVAPIASLINKDQDAKPIIFTQDELAKHQAKTVKQSTIAVIPKLTDVKTFNQIAALAMQSRVPATFKIINPDAAAKEAELAKPKTLPPAPEVVAMQSMAQSEQIPALLTFKIAEEEVPHKSKVLLRINFGPHPTKLKPIINSLKKIAEQEKNGKCSAGLDVVGYAHSSNSEMRDLLHSRLPAESIRKVLVMLGATSENIFVKARGHNNYVNAHRRNLQVQIVCLDPSKKLAALKFQ